SEAIRSNLALWKLVQAALADAGLPPDAVQLVQTTDRAAVGHLIASPEAVDVIIPRGGKGLIERISREARVPVIKHLDGNCHVYVDAQVDLDLALEVTDNAKTQKYSPCNAAEPLLVHAAILTESHPNAMPFLREVDSASVMVNASTRFADGFEYGLGAEIGISTDKFHARGPVGLEGLTSMKWVVMGQGEIRS